MVKRAIMIAAATTGFALLGYAVLSDFRSGLEIRVQYREALADTSEVRKYPPNRLSRAVGCAEDSHAKPPRRKDG